MVALRSSTRRETKQRPSSGRAPDLASVLQAIEREPVEDGKVHCAEELIAQAHAADGEAFCAAVRERLEGDATPLAADLLRLVGRTDAGGPSWRAQIIARGPASSSLDVRDAAVQAAETWGGAEVVDMLARHVEHVDWLADHIEKIVAEHGTR